MSDPLQEARQSRSRPIDPLQSPLDVLPLRLPIWEAREGTADRDDLGLSVAVSPDAKTVYAAGGQVDGPPLLIAYDSASGAAVWRHETTTRAAVRDIAVTRDGRAVLAALFHAPGPIQKHTLIALDAGTGDVLWTETKSDGSHYIPEFTLKLCGVLVSPDSSVAYMARSALGPGGSDVMVEAHSVSTGTLLWSARHDGGLDILTDLTMNPAGTMVYVTGRTGTFNEGNGIDFGTVALRAEDGEQIWVATYDADGREDFARSVVVSPDGLRVAVIGQSRLTEDFGDYVILLLDAQTGGRIWLRSHNGFDIVEDSANVGVFSRDGSQLFITGSSDDNYVTLSYDVATGARRWLAIHESGGSDDPWAIATNVISGRERVYVTGQSATLAYDAATGLLAWRGPLRADVIYSMSAGDGKVFVTGRRTQAGWWDMVTSAYAG